MLQDVYQQFPSRAQHWLESKILQLSVLLDCERPSDLHRI